MLKDIESSAAALFEGGWRAEKEQLIIEYNLTAEEAEAICAKLEEYENEKNRH
jgi:hypothetical protein